MRFFHRHVSDGFRMFWKVPVDSVKQVLRETVDFAASNVGKGSGVGLRDRCEEIKDVSRDALWRSLMISIREPAPFYPCSEVSIKERSGFVQRTISAGTNLPR